MILDIDLSTPPKAAPCASPMGTSLKMSYDDAMVRQSQPREIHPVGRAWSTISDCVRIFRSPKQAGGIVTMPWKGEIMKHLDRPDETANTLQSCNVVYLTRLVGSVAVIPIGSASKAL
jgi:shikimate 5-dehydrogenase